MREQRRDAGLTYYMYGECLCLLHLTRQLMALLLPNVRSPVLLAVSCILDPLDKVPFSKYKGTKADLTREPLIDLFSIFYST